MRFLRFSAILTAAAILFILFSDLDLSDRGFHFNLKRSEDASASDGDYDIKSLSIFSKCIGFIRSNYINPSSIDPRQALIGALKGVQSYIPAMTMRVDRAENGEVEKIRVGIGDQEKIFPLNNISDLYEMNWKFSDIMNFIAPGIPSNADSRKVEVSAINSMLKELDEHSTFLDEEMYGEMKLDTQGKFGGLGIVITSEDGYIVVVSVLEDTPAFDAGLKTRDVIIQIGEESTVNMPLMEAVSKLRGEPDTYVTILVQRKGWSEAKSYTIKRDIIAIKSTTSKYLGNGIGYLKIKHFQQDTDSELREQISKLKKFGKLTGLILDLRGNPGGLLEQAIQVSDLFLDEGVIVITEGKGGKEREVVSAKKSRSITDIPLVVLVNGGSASASEIVAGALKNNNRAVIVGNRTFGKGTVQVLYEIGKEALKLTVAQYLTPGEFSIQRIGIMPDIISIPVTVNAGRITLFNYDALPRDTEDRKRGKRLKAIGRLLEDKPEYELRYLESAGSAEKSSSDSGDSDEEEINREKSVIDKEAFKKDFQISLAESILLSSLSANREKMLSSAGSVIQSIKMIEESKIAAALEQSNINWKEEGKNEKPVVTGTLVVAGKKEALVRANEEITLQMTLKNNSKQPIYRLHALTESENPFFNEREFVFGKINPGEEKSFSLKLKIPRDQFSRFDEVKVRLFQDDDEFGRLDSLFIGIEELPRPRFSYHYSVVPKIGNEDGIVSKGETVDMKFSVRNIGEGDSLRLLSAIKNKSGEGVYIKSGRVFFKEGLKKGSDASFTFTFKVKEEFEGEFVKLEFSIIDTILREYFSEELKIKVGKRKEQIPFDGGIATLKDETIVFSGAGSQSTPLYILPRDTILHSSGMYGDWFRVPLQDGENGFIQMDDVSISGGYSLKNSIPEKYRIWANVQPEIRVDGFAAKGLLVDDDLLKISGEVVFYKGNQFRSQDNFSVIIYNGEEKLLYYKVDEVNEGKASVKFNAEIPLEKGGNLITILAYDGDEIENVKKFNVLRVDKGGKVSDIVIKKEQ